MGNNQLNHFPHIPEKVTWSLNTIINGKSQTLLSDFFEGRGGCTQARLLVHMNITMAKVLFVSSIFFLIFLGALSSSSILGSLDSKYTDQLNSYLDPVLQSPDRSRFVRCWRAKTDGWAASTFHSNCDGKGATVTIVQVGNYTFGGYTDKSWAGENLISQQT